MAWVRNVIMLIIFSLHFIDNLQVIPERAAVTYINYDFLHNATIYIKRYGRKSPYYINIEGTLKTVWANNVTLHLYFLEFLHNEYRRSFVEMHFSLCNMMNDPYIGKPLAQAGLRCPVLPGAYRLLNMTVPAENFPNVWPFEKSKVEGVLQQTNGTTLVKGHCYVLFKQKIYGK